MNAVQSGSQVIKEKFGFAGGAVEHKDFHFSSTAMSISFWHKMQTEQSERRDEPVIDHLIVCGAGVVLYNDVV